MSLFIVSPTGYVPADCEARERHAKHNVGSLVTGEMRQSRNLQFHRKLMALMQLAFEQWEPPTNETYKGEPVGKSFDRFRKDVTILAGYHTATFNIRGELRLEAQSISFANMDEGTFAQLYDKVLDVLMARVLAGKGYTKADVEDLVNRIAEFS